MIQRYITMVVVVSVARQMSPQTGSIKEKISLTTTSFLLQIHRVIHLAIRVLFCFQAGVCIAPFFKLVFNLYFMLSPWYHLLGKGMEILEVTTARHRVGV